LVKKDEVVCLLEATEIENNYKNALSDLESARADYRKIEAELNLNRTLLESQLKNIEASVNIDRLQLAHLEYVSPLRKKMIELTIQRSEVEQEKVTKQLETLKVIHQSELSRLKMKIAQSKNQLSRAKMFLDRLSLTAPVDGLIVYAISWMTDQKIKEGDGVWGGMPLITIPELSKLQVKLEASETYIKQLKNDQPVAVRVVSAQDSVFNGKILRVASVGKAIERNSKIKKFEVIVALDNPNLNLQPGISVICDIFTESIKDTISIPQESVFEEDSLKVVYIREGSKFKRQPITSTYQGENFLMITQGLAGNEELALRKPSPKLILGEK
jgi:RND family efflux transporter MFP subunit